MVSQGERIKKPPKTLKRRRKKKPKKVFLEEKIIPKPIRDRLEWRDDRDFWCELRLLEEQHKDKKFFNKIASGLFSLWRQHEKKSPAQSKKNRKEINDIKKGIKLAFLQNHMEALSHLLIRMRDFLLTKAQISSEKISFKKIIIEAYFEREIELLEYGIKAKKAIKAGLDLWGEEMQVLLEKKIEEEKGKIEREKERIRQIRSEERIICEEYFNKVRSKKNKEWFKRIIEDNPGLKKALEKFMEKER